MSVNLSVPVGSCAGDPTCIQNGAPSFFAQVSANLSTILGRLRAAAPNAEIILTGAWDSFIGAFDIADPLFEGLNAAMANAAAGKQARFADPFPLTPGPQPACLISVLSWFPFFHAEP
jgi:hypothetical protein